MFLSIKRQNNPLARKCVESFFVKAGHTFFFIFRMDNYDDKLQSVSRILSRQLFTVYEKSSEHTSINRSLCVVSDCLNSYISKFDCITGGSTAEGTMTADSDSDEMIVVLSLLVVQNPNEIIAGHSNVLIMNKSYSNPGYTRLQYLEENQVKCTRPLRKNYEEAYEETPDGIFLSSEKFVVPLLHYVSTGARRHGPCVSSKLHDYYDYQLNKSPEQKVEKENAPALVCSSWPDDEMEWFARDRKSSWPSKNLINRIRKEDCHVVPVGDPTSEYTPIEWRFSFLLAERQLIWSFNDTQLQCYFILKLLIKKHIYPKVSDEVGLSSYHLKTIVFWQSEILGISAWREDQLLHRVHDCLSYLSQCVRNGRLEHYFYRSINLLKHKLKKSDDRQFVLDRIVSVDKNLTTKVLETLPENDLSIMYSRYGRSNFEEILAFLKYATQRDYGHLKYVIGKDSEYTSGIFSMLSNVTELLTDMNLLEWAYKTIIDRPPIDVHPIHLKHILLCIHIRLGISLYRSALDHSLSLEAKMIRINKSLLLMMIGANIDNLVGNLYLATFFFCLENYSHCEALISQAATKQNQLLFTGGSETSCFIEACKPHLRAIHKHIPGIVEVMVKACIPIVFSKEDIEFVPYPLKFECAIVGLERLSIFLLDPAVYAFVLLLTIHFSKKNTVLARE